MTTGLLGKAALAAEIYTPIFTVTVDKTATANIRVVNLDQINSVKIRLAICPPEYIAGAPAAADYIEPTDFVLQAGAVLEETGIVMSSGEILVAYSTAATVTVRAHGFED